MIRGIAIALMVIYHFCFDLDLFHVVSIDFNNSLLWLVFRALIVTMFLLLVGASLYLATKNGINRQRFLKRLMLLMLCAGLVSVASDILFPKSMIFFGILHFIAVASVLGLAFRSFYRINLVLGILLIVLGTFYQHPIFNAKALQWLGLMTHRPITEDYVPILPWFGVVLIGLFIGRMLFDKRRLYSGAGKQSGLAQRALALAGRHSLLIYMVHQPVLIGSLYFFIEIL